MSAGDMLNFIIGLGGIITFAFGLLSFFLVPILCKPFRTKLPTRLYLWLATNPIKRAAIVVSEHNDVYWKQMQFDAIGVEKITMDGEEKDFSDPDGALHYWNGIPFALADEVHGILFDPRHAALGKRKHDSDSRGESNYNATESEWENWGIAKWHKAVFEFPKEHELVNLSHVRELVTGGERAEYGNRVEEMFKKSQDPFADQASISKYFYPIIAFAVTFGGIWILSSQLGGASSPDDSVSYGFISALLVALPNRDEIVNELKSYNWRLICAILFWSLAILGFEWFLVTTFGGWVAFGINFCLLLGYLFIPFIGIISRPIAPLGGAFAKLFFRLGFAGYQEPVFYWTRKEYKIKEFSHLDRVGETTWYSLFGSKVGFSFEPDPNSWDAELADKTELKERQVMDDRPEDRQPDAIADGGATEIESNLPKKYARTETMQRGPFGGFVPKRIKDSNYYLHTARALERFKSSADGHKTHRRLQEAKEKHGGGSDPLNDKTVLILTTVAGMIGAVMGVWLFLL